jgi:hypothetical protein
MIEIHEWGPGSAGAIDFEARMRRRFTRCILRSEAASTCGALEDARRALDEARELFPDAPEIAVLDGRIAEGRNRSVSPMMPVTSALSLAFEGEDDDSPVSDGRVPLTSDVAIPPPTATSFERGRALLLTMLPLTVVLVATVPGFALRPVSKTRSPAAAPPPLIREEGVVASLRPTRLQPRTLRETSVPVTAVATTGERRALSFDARAAGDDEEIRTVLKRYESAYNRLNENDRAASLISRRADREVVERKSFAPPSGRLSLGLCDITMTGEVGVARCAGTAASDPKIGGVAETSRRYWAFDLRKDADGWRIEQLKVE